MTASDDYAGDQYPYNGKVMLAEVISLSIVIFFVLLLHFYARWLLRQQQPRPVIRRVFREPLHPPDRTTNILRSHRRDKVADEGGVAIGVSEGSRRHSRCIGGGGGE
ncbi:RING-H2 finger protein ATL5-like [Canna indica]|uniref:RING-H2 finger protein ATL5-like n=1 Tax=Canna indica TaxID=4628 RepID=A0AAQ3QJR9_9LILI|nr:RING-H2 finger protein ATL5-like [Canna indica]